MLVEQWWVQFSVKGGVAQELWPIRTVYIQPALHGLGPLFVIYQYEGCVAYTSVNGEN